MAQSIEEWTLSTAELTRPNSPPISSSLKKRRRSGSEISFAISQDDSFMHFSFEGVKYLDGEFVLEGNLPEAPPKRRKSSASDTDHVQEATDTDDEAQTPKASIVATQDLARQGQDDDLLQTESVSLDVTFPAALDSSDVIIASDGKRPKRSASNPLPSTEGAVKEIKRSVSLMSKFDAIISELSALAINYQSHGNTVTADQPSKGRPAELPTESNNVRLDELKGPADFTGNLAKYMNGHQSHEAVTPAQPPLPPTAEDVIDDDARKAHANDVPVTSGQPEMDSDPEMDDSNKTEVLSSIAWEDEFDEHGPTTTDAIDEDARKAQANDTSEQPDMVPNPDMDDSAKTEVLSSIAEEEEINENIPTGTDAIDEDVRNAHANDVLVSSGQPKMGDSAKTEVLGSIAEEEEFTEDIPTGYDTINEDVPPSHTNNTLKQPEMVPDPEMDDSAKTEVLSSIAEEEEEIDEHIPMTMDAPENTVEQPKPNEAVLTMTEAPNNIVEQQKPDEAVPALSEAPINMVEQQRPNEAASTDMDVLDKVKRTDESPKLAIPVGPNAVKKVEERRTFGIAVPSGLKAFLAAPEEDLKIVKPPAALLEALKNRKLEKPPATEPRVPKESESGLGQNKPVLAAGPGGSQTRRQRKRNFGGSDDMFYVPGPETELGRCLLFFTREIHGLTGESIALEAENERLQTQVDDQCMEIQRMQQEMEQGWREQSLVAADDEERHFRQLKDWELAKETEVDELKKEMVEMRADFQKTERMQRLAMADERDHRHRELEAKIMHVTALKKEIKQINDESADALREQMTVATEEKARLLLEIESRDTEIAAMRAHITSMDEQQQHLRGSADALRDEMTASTKGNARLLLEVESKDTEMAAMRARTTAITEEYDHCQSELDAKNKRIDALEKENEKIKAEGEVALRNQMAAATEERARLSLEIESKDAGTAEMRARTTFNSSEEQQLRDKLRKKDMKISDLKYDLRHTIARFERAEQQQAALNDEDHRRQQQVISSQTELVANLQHQIQLLHFKCASGPTRRQSTVPEDAIQRAVADAVRIALQSAQENIQALEGRYQETIRSREQAWSLKYDHLKQERDLMSKVLLHHWGKDEIGPSDRQGYRYRYRTRQ